MIARPGAIRHALDSMIGCDEDPAAVEGFRYARRVVVLPDASETGNVRAEEGAARRRSAGERGAEVGVGPVEAGSQEVAFGVELPVQVPGEQPQIRAAEIGRERLATAEEAYAAVRPDLDRLAAADIPRASIYRQGLDVLRGAAAT